MARLIPLKTSLIKPGDDIVDILIEYSRRRRVKIKEKDIVIFSESALSTSLGRLVRLSDVKPSKKAVEIAKMFDMRASLVQLIMDEADEIIGGVREYHFLLTIKDGNLSANARIDKSNAPPGYVILPVEDPMKVAYEIRKKIEDKMGKKPIGVIIADSRTQPLRRGNVGIAVGVSGFMPISDERGKEDLFGKKLRVTWRAIADNITCAAEVLMGESNERTPIVIARGFNVEWTDRMISKEMLTVPKDVCMYFASLNPRPISIYKKSSNSQE
ncbi:MAG: coenzyme F420-0:L-glutamate ligase [Candidatus Asgardarchaeia archaeon]